MLPELWELQNNSKIYRTSTGPQIRQILIQLIEACVEWFVGDDPFYLKFWVNRPPRWSEIADFEPIFDRSVSALTPSEKS